MRNANLVLWLLIAVTVLAVAPGCTKSDLSQPAAHSVQRYHCPMHPTYISDKPGDCPICGMRLVPIKNDTIAAHHTHDAQTDKIAQVKPGQFYCPMNAEHVQDTPGHCPICGMELVEKKTHPAHSQTTHAVPGRTAISVSADKRQLIGLTLSKVEKRTLTKTVRTVARVEHDETRYATVAPRFAGWVQTLHVNFTGAPVEKGQPLFTVYSPELYSAQNEYLVAWRAFKQLKDDTPPAQKESVKALFDSARLRLALLEVGEHELRKLEERNLPDPEMTFYAPVSGHVIVKNAVEGKAFMAGESLYEIGDLSHLWLRAYVFEYDLPLVSVGQDAVVTFPYLTNRTYNATVTFIYPHIEPQTRRAEIRLELDNPNYVLRPEMWANVEITVHATPTLSVPASALIDTGTRYIAFVERADNWLEPREVQIGMKNDDYYEVTAGLSEGEHVVTRALFLVDSESQLKAAVAAMGTAPAHQH